MAAPQTISSGSKPKPTTAIHTSDTKTQVITDPILRITDPYPFFEPWPYGK